MNQNNQLIHVNVIDSCLLRVRYQSRQCTSIMTITLYPHPQAQATVRPQQTCTHPSLACMHIHPVQYSQIQSKTNQSRLQLARHSFIFHWLLVLHFEKKLNSEEIIPQHCPATHSNQICLKLSSMTSRIRLIRKRKEIR